MKIKIIYLLTVFCLLSAIALATTSFINNTGGAAIATRDGNVSVGNVSQSLGKLHVSGGNVYQDAKRSPVVVGSVSSGTFLDGATGVYVTKKYAYVTNQNNDSLTIVDVSNPLSPSIVGSLTDSVRLDNAMDVQVFGKYAYVVSSSNNSFSVIDVSNVSSPVLTGYITDPSQLRTAQRLYVSGIYAYVTALNNNRLTIVDISVPSAPAIVGSITNTNLTGIEDVFVLGRYAYIASTTNDSLSIVDISNASSPVLIGAITSVRLDGATAVYVSGRYAYVASSFNNSLSVIDISNVTNPTIVGYLNDSNFFDTPSDVYVSGRYAYLVLTNNAKIAVIDVSNASNLFIVGNITHNTFINGAQRIYISGKYAYVTAIAGDRLNIIDISGIDSPSASIGSVETGSLSVTENANVANDLYVGSGLNVGPNGIFSQGPLAILSGIARSVFKIISPSNVSIFFVDSGGNIGINTSTPTSLLQVNGDTNVTGTLYATNCVGCVVSGSMTADVTDGSPAGTQNLTINFTAGFNQTWQFEFYLGVNTSNSQQRDAFFSINAPSQSSCVYALTGIGGTLVDQGWESVCGIGQDIFYNISLGNPDGVILRGIVVTGNFTGPVTMEFRSSIGIAGSVTILKGSSFDATRIA